MDFKFTCPHAIKQLYCHQVNWPQLYYHLSLEALSLLIQFASGIDQSVSDSFFFLNKGLLFVGKNLLILSKS